MVTCKFPGCQVDTEAVSGMCLQHACVMWSRKHPKARNEFHK